MFPLFNIIGNAMDFPIFCTSAKSGNSQEETVVGYQIEQPNELMRSNQWI
jgi:hypothetical protein